MLNANGPSSNVMLIPNFDVFSDRISFIFIDGRTGAAEGSDFFEVYI